MIVAARPMGDRAVLLLPQPPSRVSDLAAALLTNPMAVEVLPAAETVLVRLPETTELAAAVQSLLAAAVALDDSRMESADGDGGAADTTVIPVCYDGPDLAELARLNRCKPADVVHRHSDALWRCAFVGFAPGFGYLRSADWPFDVPRLATPRMRVPAGSVAVAAGYSAVYPSPTPGGWRLIGSTDLRMFDPSAHPPALVTPGRFVRFVPVAEPSYD